MDTYEQVRALTAVIANLPETGVWTERDVMETLLVVFEPQEIVELGYGDRLDAYLQEYGGERRHSRHVAPCGTVLGRCVQLAPAESRLTRRDCARFVRCTILHSFPLQSLVHLFCPKAWTFPRK